MSKNLSFFIFLCIAPLIVLAKNDNAKIKIAIVDFNTGRESGQHAGEASTYIPELVTKEFTKRQNFDVLDRSIFSKLKNETNIQTDEEFVNSKLAETGRKYGAQYIVTGSIIQANETQTTSEELINPLNQNSGKKTVYYYTVTVSFSLKLIDMTTGKTIYNEIISHSDKQGNGNAALNNDYDNISCQIKYHLMQMFPAEINIIQLDEIDKKGRLKTVVIDQGESFFFSNAERGGPCADGGKADAKHSTLDQIGGLFRPKHGITLSVNLIEILTVNGKDYNREKEIGKLEVSKIEGAVTTCMVKEGDKEIMENFKNGKKLKIKML